MIPAIVLTALLALLAVFQIALAAGAPWGLFAWGGQQRVLPARLRVGSAISVLLYAIIAVVMLDRAGAIDLLPDVVAQVAAWVVFAYFCLGIVLNAISRSRYERFTMVPVTVVLAALSLLVALG